MCMNTYNLFNNWLTTFAFIPPPLDISRSATCSATGAPAWTVPRPKLLPATHPHASQLRFSPLSQPSPLHAPRARRSTNFQRQHKVPPTQRHTTRLASESCSHRKLCCPCVPRVLAPHHMF